MAVDNTPRVPWTAGTGSVAAQDITDSGTAGRAVLQSETAANGRTALGCAAADHVHDYAALAHAHAIADTTGLQGALDGKAASTHNHDSTYAAAVHTHSGLAPTGGTTGQVLKKNSNTNYDYGWAADSTGSGGSDPWTYLKLASDFTTSSATAVDVTGLGFAPAANTSYEFVGRLMVRTATATVGPRPGVAWPTGMIDGVAFIQQTSSATANVFANGNVSGAVLAPVGGVPTTTGSWPALIEGQAAAGATPSGNIRIQLASETAGTVVTIKAGSFLKYRTI